MDASGERLSIAYRAVFLAAGLVAAGLLFRHLLTLLLAVLITVIIAIPLSACATFLERYRVPRPIGALAGLLLGLVAIGGVLALVIPPFAEQVQAFVDDLPAIVDSLRERVADITGRRPGEAGGHVQGYLEGYLDRPERLVSPVASIGLDVLAGVGAMVVVLLTAYYMAVRPEPLIEGSLRVFAPRRRAQATRIMGRLRAAWIGWMRGVAADMVVTGVLLYAGLAIAGIDFALAFAVFSAMLVVVPYFGAVAGGIPPVLFALSDSPGKALIVLGIYVLVQQIEGNVVIPLVMSQTVKLHPAVIAVGVVLVGGLFGFLGLFVAVPLISMALILVDELWVGPMEVDEAPPGPPGAAVPADAAAEAVTAGVELPDDGGRGGGS